MSKLCLTSLLFFCNLFSSQEEYKVSMIFKRDTTCHTYVNGHEVFCECGKSPIITLFLYGNPEHFCALHVPEIEYVRPLGKNDIERLLNSLGAEANMNGGHCGL